MSDTPDVEKLYTAARELTTDLMPRLAATIPEKGTALESTIGSHSKHIAAPTPWNDPAAMLYYEIHGNARSYENLLTLRLFGHAKYRPGTNDHTTECISRLPVLIAHAIAEGQADSDVDRIARHLANWPVQIRRFLDEARADEVPWTKAPGNLHCPHCNRRLHLAPGWHNHADSADLICRTCKGEDGRPLRWAPTAWLGQLQDDPDYITAAEATEEFDLGTSTIKVWVHRGHLNPVGKRAGVRLYDRQEIAALRERSA